MNLGWIWCLVHLQTWLFHCLIVWMCLSPGWAIGWAGRDGTGRVIQNSPGYRRNRCFSTQRTIVIATRYYSHHLSHCAASFNTANEQDNYILCGVFVRVADKKKEEDEDDMAALEAWANWPSLPCLLASAPLPHVSVPPGRSQTSGRETGTLGCWAGCWHAALSKSICPNI